MTAEGTSRLLRLLSLLQIRRDWPGSLLASRLEISQRTVRRDIDRLRDMGYSIEATMGPDGGYRLDAGTQLPPLLFDDDQVIALAVALQAATVTGVGIEEAALRALTTVRQVMPSRLRHRLSALEFTTIPTHRDDPVSPTVLVTLSAAARAHEVVRFDYASPDPASEPAARRRVEPHHLRNTIFFGHPTTPAQRDLKPPCPRTTPSCSADIPRWPCCTQRPQPPWKRCVAKPSATHAAARRTAPSKNSAGSMTARCAISASPAAKSAPSRARAPVTSKRRACASRACIADHFQRNFNQTKREPS